MVFISKRNLNEEGNEKSFKKPRFEQKKSGYLGKKPFNKKEQDNKNNKQHSATPWNNPASSEFEKPDWRKLKQERKDIKLKRRQNKDLFELTVQAKQIYEKLKMRNAVNKEKLARDLHDLIKDNYTKLVMAHDTARVVQCMLKTAPADIKKEIAQNLIPHVVKLSAMKYSHFCVLRMLKYGSNTMREQIVNAMFGNIVKMTTNTFSSSLIDTAYLTWSTNKQKSLFKQEFYGDMYKSTKDETIKCLSDTYKNSPDMKSAILGAVKANLEHAINKKSVDNSLIHSVLAEYLIEANENDRNEIIIAYIPFIPSLVSTRDGTIAANFCLLHSGNKERRAMVKNMKEHIIKMCNHEHSYMLILSILTTIDDTILLKKYLIDFILQDIAELVNNEWGRKVIEWLFCPADKNYFHPTLIKSIEEGLKYCKKDLETKRKEILAIVEKPICESISNNGSLWLQGGHTGLVTGAILKMSKGDNVNNAFKSIADVICNPEWIVLQSAENNDKKIEKISQFKEIKIVGKIKKKKKSPYEDEKIKELQPATTVPGIEHSGLHIALKKIVKDDQEKIKQNELTFGSFVVDKLTSSLMQTWIPLNRACFFLVQLFECGTKNTKNKLNKLLNEHKDLLLEQNHTGSKVLIKKLEL